MDELRKKPARTASQYKGLIPNSERSREELQESQRAMQAAEYARP